MLLLTAVAAAVMVATVATSATASPLGWLLDAAKDDKPGGGVPCAACTIVLSVVGELGELDDKGIENVVKNRLCALFPETVRLLCDAAVLEFGDAIIDGFLNGDGPDRICHDVKACTLPTCALWKDSSPPAPVTNARRRRRRRTTTTTTTATTTTTTTPLFNPWQWIKHLFDRVADHLPEVDLDGDKYSNTDTLRGADWRGRDCDDTDAARRPGAKVGVDGDAKVDSNCNGIYGVNDATGVPYEKELCANSSQIGVAVLGDSAAAHFHIPPSYFNATAIHTRGAAVFEDLLTRIEDELDLPFESSWTAYKPAVPGGAISSLYYHVRERNLCAHRDYQNVAVNGARSSSMSDKIVHTLARTPIDTPLLAVLTLIGNDVCNGHPNFDHMTTPEEMYNNTLRTLTYLNSVLPPGSRVLTVGLAEGTVLYEAMHARKHPLGPTYKEIYDFLDCLQITPCWGWMNSNATVRALTQQRADQLSAVYPKVIADNQHRLKFEIGFLDFKQTFRKVIDKFKAGGGEVWQLIEPVDGFHPGAIANEMVGAEILDFVHTAFPHWLPPVNKNNDMIKKVFGEQLNGH